MTLLSRAADAPERMDQPDVDPETLRGALDHITDVNRWLGARRALLRHLEWAVPRPGAGASGEPMRVLDLGTGSGDLAEVIVRWGRQRGRRLDVVGVDLHAATLRTARSRTDGILLVRGDGLRLPFRDGAFDLVHLSMILHHMDGSALTGLLREAARAGRGGRILVGELERSVLHYLGARVLAATIWRGNAVTRHDGPLSVRRAFTAPELLELARDAGLREAAVHRHPVYRLVLRAEA
ncbi:MAG: methyltransferase domain-containing protein [Longimicrobiales bacterium]|nr:methyltransferase domain-containing protein [Longimicrobiales bacterium]